MNTPQKFAASTSVVLVSALVSGLVLLQQDLEQCSTPAQGTFVPVCTFHWQLIAAAFLTALISGAVHALQTHLAGQQDQITANQVSIAAVAATQSNPSVPLVAAVPVAAEPVQASATGQIVDQEFGTASAQAPVGIHSTLEERP